ncbi:glycosyltransferase family 2 protein [Micromonospora sp. AMSO31t]|uniref:glycosyltransferase n=1 Tax=Micromonospora sp. AMSO31t TaxID=2650566 RepID=UPI001CEC93C6|nr:glycosyltransferase family 2 protein [Micromonospora sp. AMSO31t]
MPEPAEPRTISVVIAAHNEATVLGGCLDGLLADAEPGELDIVVVANGCTDATAEVAAARSGVRVVELAEAGKARALNAGDAVARGFPRFYLDADVVLSSGALRRMADVLTADGSPPLAVTPRRAMVTDGRSLPVRGYYAISTRLPIFADALFGRGTVGLSAAGRARFEGFPAEIADDMFLDSLFSSAEKCEVAGATSYVQAPRRTPDLVRTLARVRAGNTMLRASHAGVRPSARSSWLRDVVLPRPWLIPAAAIYVTLTLVAASRARRHPRDDWGRDDSTR